MSFSSLIAVAGNSINMFNKSGKTGHPYLVTDNKRKAFIFSPFNTIPLLLGLGLLHNMFIMVRYVPSIPLSWVILL